MIHNANNGNWTRSYGYASDSNRLESTAVGQTTLAYTHNVNGSMTTMPHLQAMDWDFAERLSHVTRGTTEAYYNYDGSGQRIRKVVEKNSITETRLYLGGFEIYRKATGGTLDMERETLHVMDDKNRVALVETKTVDAGVAIANPVSVLRYQLDNHLGSASLELDQNASVISYEEYYPYGDTSYQAGRSTSEVSRKRYRYTGKEKDEESGLYYHGARYYACWLGRWTASDPAGLVDGVNLYMYVRGNPVRLIDDDGKRSGPSPDHDVLGQLTGGPVDPTCTFNCGKSIQEVPSGGGNGPEKKSTSKQAPPVDPKDKKKLEPQNPSVGQGNGGSGEKVFGEGNTVGAQFEKLAIKAGQSGSSAGVWGWSAAAAIWETVGPEAISQIADKKFNTGEKVTAGEWVAGGIDVAGIVPALKALKGVKAVAPLIKRGDKAIVLGEDMKDIKTIAHRLQGEGINAKWYQAWGKNFPKDRLMTPDELKKAMVRNERWLKTKIREGYKIYDIGIDPIRPTRSPFYELEQKILKAQNYPTIQLGRP